MAPLRHTWSAWQRSTRSGSRSRSSRGSPKRRSRSSPGSPKRRSRTSRGSPRRRSRSSPGSPKRRSRSSPGSPKRRSRTSRGSPSADPGLSPVRRTAGADQPRFAETQIQAGPEAMPPAQGRRPAEQQPYQGGDAGRGSPVPAATQAQPGYAQAGFAAQEPAHAQNGQSQNGFGQRTMSADDRAQMPGAAAMAGQNGMAAGGMSGVNAAGLASGPAHGLQPGGIPANGRPANGMSPPVNGQPRQRPACQRHGRAGQWHAIPRGPGESSAGRRVGRPQHAAEQPAAEQPAADQHPADQHAGQRPAG